MPSAAYRRLAIVELDRVLAAPLDLERDARSASAREYVRTPAVARDLRARLPASLAARPHDFLLRPKVLEGFACAGAAVRASVHEVTSSEL